MNQRGFRTKAYTSRRNVRHAGREFSLTTVQHLLKNPAYIGKKLIDGAAGRHLVEAVWPAIVEQEKFDEVQALLARNGRANRSGVKAVRHAHVLSNGLLFCGRCRSRMTGRSGTGRQGATYFYYACLNKDCGLRVVASEIEDAVLDRVALLAGSPEIVGALCAEANRRRARRVPALQKQLRAQLRALANVRAQAARLLSRDDPSDASAARSFVDDQLSDLARQRDELEGAILETESALRDLQVAAIDPDAARAGLANFHRVYEHLRPFEKQELIRLVLHRAEVGDRQIVLELYEGACASFAQAPKSATRFEPPIWLPEAGDFPNGLEFDVALYLDCSRKRIDGERRYRFPWDEPPEPLRPAPPSKRRRPNPVSSAREWRRSMEERGESKAELAHRLGVTRARVTQVLKVLDLDPAVLAFVEGNPDPRITERALRSIVHRPPAEQQKHIDELLASAPRTKRRTSNGRPA